MATGNFGESLTTQPGNSVGHIVLDAIPWTLGLVGVTTVLAFILGTGIGIVSAWRRGGRLDSIMPPIFVIMTVIPYFWLGLVLILVFGVKLHWLPYFFTLQHHAHARLQLGVHQQRARARHPARVHAADHARSAPGS